MPLALAAVPEALGLMAAEGAVATGAGALATGAAAGGGALAAGGGAAAAGGGMGIVSRGAGALWDAAKGLEKAKDVADLVQGGKDEQTPQQQILGSEPGVPGMAK